MKVVLSCQHCFADHEISQSKVAGKHGKFRCIRCKALTPFSFVTDNSKTSEASENPEQPKNHITLFDLNYDQPIPKSPLRGQFHGTFQQNINVYWFQNKVLFLRPEDHDIFDPQTHVTISGILDPKKLRGLQFDVKPNDPPTLNREVLVSDAFRSNSGYRLSLYIEEQDQKFVKGRLYFAIPDSLNTYFYGSFVADKILSVKFSQEGSSDVILPDFLSNFLTAKVLLLSGNIIYVQDSFNRLTLDEKEQLFIYILEFWKPDSSEGKTLVRFFKENIEFEIAISEKKLNEAIVFLVANQVQVGEAFWSSFKKKIKKSLRKDESYIQILKKRYPGEVAQIFEDIANRMVIPKDPSSIIARDDLESFKALLESGYSANFVKENDESNPLRFSMLQDAVSGETSKCALFLLENGADPNYLDKIGENAIFKLCQNSLMHLQEKMQVIDELLKRGIDVNHQSYNKMTALHWCALFGEPSLAKKLIQSGINIELTDLSENSALHEACKFGHSSVLALLLEAGARANLANDENQTGRDLAFEALEIAQLHGDTETQERMERILSLLDVYGG
jgi:hypothetical protein